MLIKLIRPVQSEAAPPAEESRQDYATACVH